MAPELDPVTNTYDMVNLGKFPKHDAKTRTWLASPLYLESAYVTMLAMASLSPPPLCVKAASDATSQQVPSYGD